MCTLFQNCTGSAMGDTIQQWRATIGGFPANGKSRIRRRKGKRHDINEVQQEAQEVN